MQRLERERGGGEGGWEGGRTGSWRMRSGFIWLEHGVLSVGERKMAPGGGGGETLVEIRS